MNNQLLKYYKEYLNKQNYNYNNPGNNLRFLKILPNQILINDNNKSNQYISLFIECLLSCNNLEKYNIELFGNNIEIKLFNEFNWNLEKYDNNNTNINIIDYKSFKNNNYNKSNSFDEFNFNLIEKRIIDIFPNNYYKITESSKYNNNSCHKKKISKNKTQGNIMENRINNYLSQDNKLEKHFTFNNINEISKNIKYCKINSYKLRIFKKFIKNGTLNSAAIVFNFITNELRFMIKGMPEDILEKCDKNTFPDNLENVISYHRKNGFFIIMCASKLINIEEYKDSNDFDYYMNDLTFCGFITIKNIIKENVKKSIHELKKFNYNLIITSGDNEYNCLSLGFKCGIIENKNIYSFDIDDYVNKLILKKLYKAKIYNDEDRKSKIEKNSNSNSKKSNNNIKFNLNDLKENFTKIDITANPQYKNKIFKNDKIEKKKSKLVFENSERGNFNNSLNFNFSECKEKDSNSNLIIPKTIKKNFKKINLNRIKRQKIYQNKENREENSFKRNKSFISNGLIKNKDIFCYEKVYYYPKIFKDYEELKDNCIFCISGKAFNFLYKNKQKKECKNLLEKICKNCKIFFNMSSLNKSFLVDYYRENPNNYICNIGECESDIDSLITSNVGIKLKKPNNQNTLLFHFYSSKKGIDCIKTIIMEGRIFYEKCNSIRIFFIFMHNDSKFFYSLLPN